MNELFSRAILTVLVLSILLGSAPAQVYVSPTGDDLNPGTLAFPFKTFQKAYAGVSAGDTIFVRGGLYDSLLTTITFSKSGSVSARYHVFAYQSERPVLNFSLMVVGSSNRGIRISGSYWHVKGIDIKGAGDNGMNISGSNNIVEFCSFYENHDTGLQIGGGASNNQIINCDSFFNEDPSQGNADGFAAKLDVGTGNYFYGCRAWENSDDGYDGYLRPSNDVTTILNRCWAFKNGYLKSGATSTGNGNGFKLGGSDNADLMHNVILRNCVAFDNRVKGFDQNNDRGSMTLQNCTAYRNGTNYSISGPIAAGKTLTVTNCVALGSYGSLAAFAVQQTNGWMSPFVVAADDFQSTDTAGVRGSRQPDGSLPELPFMKLAAGSDLIDAGTFVFMEYNGSAPDLGAFETGVATSVVTKAEVPVSSFLARNYPNPFNPSTTISYEIPGSGVVAIRIYDLEGRLIQKMMEVYDRPGRYFVKWNGSDEMGILVPSGIYFAMVRFGSQQTMIKMQLIR